ncbi:TIGR03749 family integrating conjugative element protein [Pectobacterium versatile]|uniref:TIGR03749 family integrating conjugative element protein n=1 Tax=Pectobacterium versatile TaxID=2488639 RepID=UPI001CCAC1B3|nr:TIGR03749 family integrating conjugative element protein [Pectobacterium versatile]
MKLKALLAICVSLLSLPTSALELMKWERIPLQIPLNVGQERIVFVDKNVRVGFPPSLSGKLRIQSSGGSVYLSASEPFPSTRLQLQDVENGEVILLDISAVEGKSVREPVQVVYTGEVSSVSTNDNAKVSGSSNKASHPSSSRESADKAERHSPVSSVPVPVLLTRYAAQSLYAPLRTVEPVPGIGTVSLKLPSPITTLFPSEPVVAVPLAGWRLNNFSVIALQIRNTSSGKVILDPRRLQGKFVSATFQHRWLGNAGTPEDTTVVYLVIDGQPESAFLPEPALPSKPVKSTSRGVTK